jgi:hypothetical protein
VAVAAEGVAIGTPYMVGSKILQCWLAANAIPLPLIGLLPLFLGAAWITGLGNGLAAAHLLQSLLFHPAQTQTVSSETRVDL